MEFLYITCLQSKKDQENDVRSSKKDIKKDQENDEKSDTKKDEKSGSKKKQKSDTEKDQKVDLENMASKQSYLKIEKENLKLQKKLTSIENKFEKCQDQLNNKISSECNLILAFHALHGSKKELNPFAGHQLFKAIIWKRKHLCFLYSCANLCQRTRC